MTKKTVVKEIIADFQAGSLPDSFPRTIDIPLHTGKIISLVGARRCGKTFVLYQIIKKLTQSVDKRQIIFINFEDERLDLKTEDLDLILQAFRELFPDQDLRDCYMFFDEIQNVENWERFVRRVHDTITDNVFITGSNARLLSSEIATSLRGRSISYEIFPLSFPEFLAFRNAQPEFSSAKAKGKVIHLFHEYLRIGGFPEIVRTPDQRIRSKILNEYFNVMIFKDLVERYKIINIPALKHFIKKAFASSTKPFSIHKIYNELKSAGIKIGKTSLYEFLEECEAVFLTFVLKKYAEKISAMGEQKIFAIDIGLLNNIVYKFSADVGKALELAVFLELRRRGEEIFYYKDRVECDFLIHRNDQISEAIQVASNIDLKSTRDREFRGLLKACKRFNLKKGFILTMDTEKTIDIDGVNIDVVPAWKKLLEKEW